MLHGACCDTERSQRGRRRPSGSPHLCAYVPVQKCLCVRAAEGGGGALSMFLRVCDWTSDPPPGLLSVPGEQDPLSRWADVPSSGPIMAD